MASPGNTMSQQRVVSDSLDSVMSRFVSATAGASDYSMNSAGRNTLVLTRQYRPTWAIVLAILGLIFFLIGLLFLLVKNTETLTVTLASEAGGTRVNVTGRATHEMASRIESVLAGASAAIPEHVESPGAAQRGMKSCPDCAESVREEARVCRFCGYRFDETQPAPE